MKIGLCVAVLFLSVVATSKAQVRPSIEKAYEALQHENAQDYPTTQEKAAAIANLYSRSLDPWQIRLEEVNSEEVSVLFNSADIAAFYTPNEHYVRQMEDDAHHLLKAGRVTSREYEELYRSYLQVRAFNKARSLAHAQNLHLEKIPEITGSPVPGTPGILSVDDQGRKLTWRPVDLRGKKIIVVAHPSCHFTQNAVAYFDHHKNLLELISKNSVWVTPPARSLDLFLVTQWNKAHPKEKMTLASSQAAWSMIPTWETPSFYFFENGRIVEKVVGWPKSGNAEALRAAISKIGLDGRQSLRGSGRNKDAIRP